jgi:peroxiredoxin
MKRRAFNYLSIFFCLGVLFIALVTGCDWMAPRVVLEKGQPAPGFELADMDGNTWRLNDLRGKVVLINFWATWCPSCISEMPSLQNLILKKNNPGFVVLTIVFEDDPFRAYSYVKSNNYSFPVLKDPDGSTAEAYGLTGVPETFVVDKKGILRKKVIGPTTFDDQEVLTYLERLEKE